MASLQAQLPQSNYVGSEPQLATLERLDTEPEVVESTPPEHQLLTDIGTHPMSNTPLVNGDGGHTSVSFLGLSQKLTQVLTSENWTIEKLAEAKSDDLIPYPGIGTTRANQIVESAKQWLEQTQ